MQDRQVVAAVVAGDPDGLAAAYDQYAAPLYAYCHLMLPDPADAADAVRDTFLIATVKLEGLRDADRLRAWLYAVARNECLRRLGAAGVPPRPPKVPAATEDDEAPGAIALPAGLRGQVLKACTDSTPAGRAERASAAHRAGSFGPTGFPKAMGSTGPQWWQQVRQHPRAAAAATAVTAAAVTAAIIAVLAVGGSHRAQAATIAVRGSEPVSPAPGLAGASPTSGHRGTPTASGQASAPSPSVTAPAGGPSPGTPSAPEPPASVPASASPSGTPASAAPTASSSTATPGEGVLAAEPDELLLTATKGKAVSGTFQLFAEHGPVPHYWISVPAAMAGKVTVSPAKGSLPAFQWVPVTVTVTSKVAVKTKLTVEPGDITVTVVLSIKG